MGGGNGLSGLHGHPDDGGGVVVADDCGGSGFVTAGGGGGVVFLGACWVLGAELLELGGALLLS
ncbi:hypothetical protein [Lentzea sp. E54]|uniref:hypothetical protein n=1 Tax=Lentzea xerophila TaxID=3435883 RepID=UPI003DA62A51